jgi:YbgC/YbaW family acyl-CoA thioester hydrolase
VYRLSVRYFVPVAYGDEVEIATWISGLRGVRSTRDYDLTRARDGARVARARAEWVYVDVEKGQPTRCPDAWAEALPKGLPVEGLGVRLNDPRPTEGAHRYTSRRRVQFVELDAARHVNHAVYLQWTGEAFLEALRACGYPLEQTQQEGWLLLPTGHEVQYFAPALGYDNIEIVSWVSELGEARLAWTQEVYNADTRKLLARDYSPMAFFNLQHEPTPASLQAIEGILRGQTG